MFGRRKPPRDLGAVFTWIELESEDSSEQHATEALGATALLHDDLPDLEIESRDAELEPQEVILGMSQLFKMMMRAQIDGQGDPSKVFSKVDSLAMYSLAALLQDANTVSDVGEDLNVEVDRFSRDRIVDDNNILMPVGYNGHVAYEVNRIMSLYDIATKDPKRSREDLVSCSSVCESEEMRMQYLPPMKVSDDEEVKVFDPNVAGYTLPPTASLLYERWRMRLLSELDADE